MVVLYLMRLTHSSRAQDKQHIVTADSPKSGRAYGSLALNMQTLDTVQPPVLI